MGFVRDRPSGLFSVAGVIAVMSAVVVGAALPGVAGTLPPGGTFTDDNGNAHEGFIEAIAAAGITSGCGGDWYCPAEPVTRGQMASFLARALSLPDSATDWFTDDDGSTHEANINKIADAGITLGFGDGTFAPDDDVPRDQMASFLARAIPGLDPAGQDYFPDDDGNTHEANINIMAQNAITLGCDSEGTIYCPGDPVRRDQMASFLGRALGLTEIVPPPLPDPEPADIVQAIYAVPADVAAVPGRDAAVRNEIEEVQAWYDGQTGGRHPVFSRDAGGAVSVVTVVLPDTLADLSAMVNPEAAITAAVNSAEPDTAGKYLAVVMEGDLGTGYCGRTGSVVFIPIGNCDIGVSDTSVWPYGGTYLMGHELTHLLGAVPGCAPNSDGTGHVDDDNRDVLFSGGARDWDNLMLDPGNDDYYGHGRDDCTDIADSALLGTY